MLSLPLRPAATSHVLAASHSRNHLDPLNWAGEKSNWTDELKWTVAASRAKSKPSMEEIKLLSVSSLSFRPFHLVASFVGVCPNGWYARWQEQIKRIGHDYQYKCINGSSAAFGEHKIDRRARARVTARPGARDIARLRARAKTTYDCQYVRAIG